MNIIWETVLRTFIGFFVLLVLARLLGKKLIGQMTYFTYITGIAMGDIAADAVVHRDVTVLQAVTGLILWTLLTFIVEYISLKSGKARVLLDGQPSILIKEGVIQMKELTRLRLNLDDMTMLMRNRGIFSMKEIDYAVLEPNGQLSVLKKPEYESITKRDMNVTPAKRRYMPSEIIVDGKVIAANLRELSLTVDWLREELERSGIVSPKDVSFAELQSDGTLYIPTTEKHT